MSTHAAQIVPLASLPATADRWVDLRQLYLDGLPRLALVDAGLLVHIFDGWEGSVPWEPASTHARAHTPSRRVSHPAPSLSPH